MLVYRKKKNVINSIRSVMIDMLNCGGCCKQKQIEDQHVFNTQKNVLGDVLLSLVPLTFDPNSAHSLFACHFDPQGAFVCMESRPLSEQRIPVTHCFP